MTAASVDTVALPNCPVVALSLSWGSSIARPRRPGNGTGTWVWLERGGSGATVPQRGAHAEV
jgi:hypothetical protein